MPSKVLGNWLIGAIPLQTPKKGEIPPYPDSGVDYAGYSKQEIPAGWRLRPQTQFWYKVQLVHPWVSGPIVLFNNQGKALFVTKIMFDWNMLLATGTVPFYFSPTAVAGDSLVFFRANGAARESVMQAYDFDPPIRFDRLLYLIIGSGSTGATEQLNILLWGYTEEL